MSPEIQNRATSGPKIWHMNVWLWMWNFKKRRRLLQINYLITFQFQAQMWLRMLLIPLLMQRDQKVEQIGGWLLEFFLPLTLLAISSFSNSVYITIMSASGLESVSVTSLLFWVFASGSVTLWILSAIFESIILPKSMSDKIFLFVVSISTTTQTYLYILGAKLLYPTVLAVAETFGIPVFFIVQISFLHSISQPENLPLQVASVFVIFLVSLGLPLMEMFTDSKGNVEEKDSNGTK